MNQEIKRNSLRDFLVFSYTTLRYAIGHSNESVLKDLRKFSQWMRYRKAQAEISILEDRSPWMVFTAIDFLKQWLKKDMKVFEYGSGGSTIFFADRVRSVISVEHDAAWYKVVFGSLKQAGYSHVDYRLFEPEDYPAYSLKKRNEPKEFISYYHGFSGKRFKNYATAIANFTDDTFDLVVVDGRARSACIQQSLPKIRKGGYLLLDNADRPAYLLPFDELKDPSKWERTCYTGHFPMGPASILNKTEFFKKLY